MSRIVVAALCAAAVGACAAAPASAQSADRQDVAIGFTATQPNSPTGDFFKLTVKDPAHPDGKPPRVTRIVSVAPPGSPTDPSALPHCTASDPELIASGAAACPPGSLDGTGFAEFVTGFGVPADPLMLDLQDFYNGHGLSVVATPRGTTAHLASHTEFQGPGGEMAVTDFPELPGGPPDGETVLRRTELTVPEHGNFFKTPPTCPSSGHWTFRVLVTYADGVTQESDRDSPCVQPSVTPAARTHRRKRGRSRHHRGHRHRPARFTG